MKSLSNRLGSGLLVATALVLSQAAPARAADQADKPMSKADIASAKKHYGEGDKKYKAGDLAGAEVEFKAANDIKATPQTERYIGLCEDGQGHFQSAVEWYDRFLAHVPEKMAAQGDEIKKRESDIKALPGKLHLDSNPAGASVTIDDKPQPAPTPTDVQVPPGTHVVKFTATGACPPRRRSKSPSLRSRTSRPTSTPNPRRRWCLRLPPRRPTPPRPPRPRLRRRPSRAARSRRT